MLTRLCPPVESHCLMPLTMRGRRGAALGLACLPAHALHRCRVKGCTVLSVAAAVVAVAAVVANNWGCSEEELRKGGRWRAGAGERKGKGFRATRRQAGRLANGRGTASRDRQWLPQQLLAGWCAAVAESGCCRCCLAWAGLLLALGAGAAAGLLLRLRRRLGDLDGGAAAGGLQQGRAGWMVGWVRDQ